MIKRIFYFLLLLIATISCTPQIIESGRILKNQKSNEDKPYVILISLDGYRWDYTQRFKPINISNFIEKGVQAESLIPCFPTKTFPNHYTIATGMYPDHHGLINNNFYSPELAEKYTTRDRDKVQNGKWYGGTPIWVQATKVGFVTASYFFVGSEATIQATRPSYYYNYDGSVPNDKRVDQALSWLNMPADKRPHLITLYFSDMDDAGHQFGPNNDEQLAFKLFALDKSLGKLFSGINKTGLDVNIIIVSDHGMLDVPIEQFMPIEAIENEDLFQVVNNGAIVHIYLNEKNSENQVLNVLKEKAKNYKVFKTSETPGFDYSPKNNNWGDIQIVTDKGWYFSSQRSIAVMNNIGKKVKGEHGFSPENKELHGIFYANGPAFKKGYKIESLKNIHIYPLICKILGLEIPADIDGRLSEIESILN